MSSKPGDPSARIGPVMIVTFLAFPLADEEAGFPCFTSDVEMLKILEAVA